MQENEVIEKVLQEAPVSEEIINEEVTKQVEETAGVQNVPDVAEVQEEIAPGETTDDAGMKEGAVETEAATDVSLEGVAFENQINPENEVSTSAEIVPGTVEVVAEHVENAENPVPKDGGKKNSKREKTKKEKPKKEKPEKVKPEKVKTEKEKPEKENNKKEKVMILSIRNKIVLCFIIPIIFMIIVGFSAYNKAAEGMSNNFIDSTTQTIATATDYVDMVCEFLKAEAMRYAFSGNVTQYLSSTDDINAHNSYGNTVYSEFTSSKMTNSFIGNIHLIPRKTSKIITSAKMEGTVGVFDDYKKTCADGMSIVPWVDSHETLDPDLQIKASDKYIMAYQMITQNKNACVIIDIKESAMLEFLQGIDLGNGSIVGFVTPGGTELAYENIAEGEEGVIPEGENAFISQEFYADINASESLSGNEEVKYQGRDYIFLYSVSDVNGAVMCALVPTELVTGQAESIRSLTVILVIIATVIVLAVGMLIVSGIQGNMKGISKKFGEVAKGDLTVKITARGNDEFRGLAGSANNMVKNTKKLVNKVNGATNELEQSAKDVGEASGIISKYSQDITQAITDINEGMERQSVHAQECVSKTNTLSKEIQDVSVIVERVGKLVGETEGMINQGMEIVKVLGERAEETTTITAKVGDSIESLRQESEVINTFVDMITEISNQTNLLSLNASIEAARAGEAGRGFAVVAEEIRKLADDSANAAKKIRNNVGHISVQTMNSVESASQAQDMVALQTEAVEQAVDVFQQMQDRMHALVEGLNEIVSQTECADRERSEAVDAVRNISDIIEETASSAETVKDVANKLLENVENLNDTAAALGENMNGLKNEISVFKVE